VDGAARIRRARVAVVGIGGVGSWAAEALARSGVGQLVLVDLDHVAESNINRQAQALSTTIGQAKVRAMQERIALIHPQCQVACIEAFVEPANWPQLLDGPVHAVIDACDQVSAKVAMAAWACQGGKGFISVGAAGGKRLAHKVDIDDLSRVQPTIPCWPKCAIDCASTTVLPAKARPFGIPGVFSREPVAPPDASCAVEGDGSLNCHGYGSVVSVTATFGLCAAGWVLDFLARTDVTSNE
jgi:tRNA A37 threonylcarbamoyladenosine dehydratase